MPGDGQGRRGTPPAAGLDTQTIITATNGPAIVADADTPVLVRLPRMALPARPMRRPPPARPPRLVAGLDARIAVVGMTAPTLHRETFATPRAAEFFELRALQAQTGQPSSNFAAVLVKELVDNALDAAETAGVLPEISIEIGERDDRLQITVADNGPGMPPELVARVLDFEVLVSDKAAYRSPTRGMQGNALKTVVGIPHALGGARPVMLEARGVRHEITAAIDPAGELRIGHCQTEIPERPGTRVVVTIPLQDQELIAWRWALGFALVNPHATVRIRQTAAAGYLANGDDLPEWDSYQPTAGAGWSKPLPTDPTSPWWYDERALARLVFAHIAKSRQGGRDLPLREFVRTFRGLTSTAKAKQVGAALPGITYLSGFERDPAAVGTLLEAMWAETRVPEPKTLGWGVDESHYRQALETAYGVKRFWFKRAAFTDDGIPWVVEVAVAETIPNAEAADGGVTFAVNYSPSFGDPLARTRLRCPEFTTTGAESFLTRADANPDAYAHGAERNRAAVVHLICPAPEFLDKGKTALTVSEAVAEQAGRALWAATRTLHADAKRRERDAVKAARRAAERTRERHSTEWSLKDAVFEVLPDAIAATSGAGAYPFPTRNLYYAVRSRIQQLTTAKLEGNYFSQTLIVDYEQEHGRIPGHYREPRGELREPHTGGVVRLGTREVAAYELPSYVFDKILYVEKEGFQPIFEAARLAERYDMAIAYGKGQPVEAIRALFERAEAGDYRLFVLHDADPAGYSIARSMAEETNRMPGYSVEVVDLGLSVGDAIGRGLEIEKFTRRKALPWWMPDRLDEQERAWFEGRPLTPSWVQKKQWECTRVELNALTAPDLIAFIEAQLEAANATEKIVPPADVLERRARDEHRDAIADLVKTYLAERFDADALIQSLAGTFPLDTDTDLAQVVTQAHEQDRATWWKTAIDTEADRQVDEQDERIRDQLAELLAERIQAGGDA